METVPQYMLDHMKEDTDFKKQMLDEVIPKLDAKMGIIIANQEKTLTFMKQVETGEKIIRWSWNNMAKIGSLGLAILFLVGVLKYGFLGAISWFFKMINGL